MYRGCIDVTRMSSKTPMPLLLRVVFEHPIAEGALPAMFIYRGRADTRFHEILLKLTNVNF